MKRFLTIIFSILFFCIQTLAFTVVIDPGHGGRDVGALGRVSKEKDINLKVALALETSLRRIIQA